MKDGNDGAEGLLDEVAVADKLEKLRNWVVIFFLGGGDFQFQHSL